MIKYRENIKDLEMRIKIINNINGDDEYRKLAENGIYKWFLDNFYCEPYNCILDLGCGIGNFGLTILNKFEMTNYIGMDINKELLIKAQDIFLKNKYKYQCQFIQADFNKSYHLKSHLLILSSLVSPFTIQLMYQKRYQKLEKC